MINEMFLLYSCTQDSGNKAQSSHYSFTTSPVSTVYMYSRAVLPVSTVYMHSRAVLPVSTVYMYSRAVLPVSTVYMYSRAVLPVLVNYKRKNLMLENRQWLKQTMCSVKVLSDSVKY